MDHYPTRNRAVELVTIAIFLFSLYVPFLLGLVQKDIIYSETEKRELQTLPILADQESVAEFTRTFDGYYQDHFGLREWLVHRYQREVRKRFGISGAPNVYEGKNGWLFFSGNQASEDLKGRLKFSNQEKQLFWETLTRKAALLKKRGAAYIFLVAPNKQSIYPEHHPLYYQLAEKESRLDSLLAGNPESDNRNLLDIRPLLRQEKARERLYHKSDTHWNSKGAYLAYQAIMDRVKLIFPDFGIQSNFVFSPVWEDVEGGDLALMIGRQKSTVEKNPVLEKHDFTAVRKKLDGQLVDLLLLSQLEPHYTEKKHGQLRVLVLHDSFFTNIIPFMSESFAEVLYVWQYYDTATLEFFNKARLEALLDIFQPDLVIEETVERQLAKFFPVNAWLTNRDLPGKVVQEK